MIHPARTIPYKDLKEALDLNVGLGLVRVVQASYDPRLLLYCYTKECQFTKAWTPATTLARGLILDTFYERVVATPFPKFFNAGEPGVEVPSLPFRTFEKVDGSLIILFFYGGTWRCATKGSFTSDQARWARDFLAHKTMTYLHEDATYLFEAVYPENRIVIKYEHPELVGLGAYRGDGTEMPWMEFADHCYVLDLRVADEYYYPSFGALLECTAGQLCKNSEGFVAVFDDGTRLKVKTEWYCRLHRLVSRITPLAIWEMMLAGDDLEVAKRELPEEFLNDFDRIVLELTYKRGVLLRGLQIRAEDFKDLTDKELGLILRTLPPLVQKFIFPQRRYGDLEANPKSRRALYEEFRPKGNVLEGYTPSSSMTRVTEELNG